MKEPRTPKPPPDPNDEIRKLKVHVSRLRTRLDRMETGYVQLQLDMRRFIDEGIEALAGFRPKIIITRPVEGLTDEEVAALPVVEQEPFMKPLSDFITDSILRERGEQ